MIATEIYLIEVFTPVEKIKTTEERLLKKDFPTDIIRDYEKLFKYAENCLDISINKTILLGNDMVARLFIDFGYRVHYKLMCTKITAQVYDGKFDVSVLTEEFREKVNDLYLNGITADDVLDKILRTGTIQCLNAYDLFVLRSF